MLQVTAQTRILVAAEPVDFRCGIDGLARICRAQLRADPFSGTLFLFRNRRGTGLKILAYDGQGFWLCQKRLSEGRLQHWPVAAGAVQLELLAHELQVLLAGGDPLRSGSAPAWRALPKAQFIYA